jgi:hypothetical protein
MAVENLIDVHASIEVQEADFHGVSEVPEHFYVFFCVTPWLRFR